MSQTAQQAPIFFCDETALQIVRAACDRKIVLPKTPSGELPQRAPLQREVLAAIDSVETTFLGLKLARPVHVLVGSKAHCHRDGLRVSHICTTGLSAGSFYDLGMGLFACSPALAFVRAAAWGATDVGLLQLGFELCGTYSTGSASVGPSYGHRPLVTPRHLLDYASANSSMKGARTAARLCAHIAGGSASPRETKMALLLGLPRSKGGMGLGVPCMNYEVKASREASLIAGRATFRCDLCWPGARLDVEYQSREVHSNEASRIGDSRRGNALAAMGWRVVGVTNDELDSVVAFGVIAQVIEEALGKGGRPAVSGWRDDMLDLRLQLGLPVGSWSAH